jgi:hypothetical protein
MRIDNRAIGVGQMIGGEGVFDNATGVAILLALAERIYEEDIRFDFNLIFAFFSGEEQGLHGSNYFVNNNENGMTSAERTDTLLMVNIDCVGGDHLYMYSDEVRREHFDFFTDLAEKLELSIKRGRSGARIFETRNFSLPFLNYFFMSDSRPFYDAGINLLAFRGGNDSTSSIFSMDGVDQPSVINTGRDTLKHYLDLYGESGPIMMDAIVDLLFEGFSDGEFVATMIRSREGRRNLSILANRWFIGGMLAVAMVGAGGLIYLISKKAEEHKVDPKAHEAELEAIENIQREITQFINAAIMGAQAGQPPQPDQPFQPLQNRLIEKENDKVFDEFDI